MRSNINRTHIGGEIRSKELFNEWLELHPDLSDSSKKSYLYAIGNIPNWVSENLDFDLVLNEATEISKIDEIMKIPLFIEKNRTIHNTWSAALNKYKEFLKQRNYISNKYWFVGSSIKKEDQTQRFLDEGIWENGFDDKYTELVNSVNVGDKIAIKSTYTRKNHLPFDNKGAAVSVMAIKAIGIVTKNYGDGKFLDVTWKEINPKKEWYFFALWDTIQSISENDGWKKKNLIDFTFNDGIQGVDRFLNDPSEDELSIGETIAEYNVYTKNDFLSEVFISGESYETIKSLLMRKKNLILQGAPGVGKTFAAKRLAYSIMGKKDDSKIKMIQFHQSYSYEDFMMGYRPNGSGFELKEGPFYQFCKEASNNPNEDYYFIIDEINRGNMSKIFGELMMLIESDKRGEELTLTYSDEPFSVPNNLYIIGMMNTADKSLAIIDYALRRRFCFFELEPAFDSELFKKQLLSQDANESLISKIVIRLGNVNTEITKDISLGKGFRIGHSYFCQYSEVANWYEDVIKYEIEPLIREYWYEDDTKVIEILEDLLV